VLVWVCSGIVTFLFNFFLLAGFVVSADEMN
jgi:hypothetical protein